MDTGMLWFDNNPKTLLSAKVQKAADYYTKKYGKAPTLCLVHPSMLSKECELDSIQIRPFRPVLPGHLWIGIDDDAESVSKEMKNEQTTQMGLEVNSGQE